jgi:MFS transporter, YNFM family, putative membrane transport protein
MMAAAFCTFALIYCVQPLLPMLAAEFKTNPATSSLALSVTTFVLAFSIVAAGLWADAFDRKSFMGWSLVIAAVLSIGTALAQTFYSLLITRALCGLALGGLPAVAMAYIGEEIDPRSSGQAMGLYVSGTALGGMSGRLWAGVLSDLLSWRWAIGIIGVFGLFAGALFWLLLPPGRHSVRRTPSFDESYDALLGLARDAGMRWLFLVAFLLMGSFVSVYNYLGFRLMATPYNLSPSSIGLLFVVYVVGMFSSAWAGRLAGRHGPWSVLWIMVSTMLGGILLTIFRPLWVIIGGVSAVTFGFFGGHAVASGWVTRRAGKHKALGSSLYLFAYYAGSSLIGSSVGVCWARKGWTGVFLAVGGLVVFALFISRRLMRLQSSQRVKFALVENELPHSLD